MRERLGAGRFNGSCKRNALRAVLAGLLLTSGVVATSGQALFSTPPGAVHGTVLAADPPRLRLSVRTEDGRQVELAVANVDAMRAVQRGDHIRVDVDRHGIALNIHKTPSTPRPVSYSRG
jgi:hypothetical protein